MFIYGLLNLKDGDRADNIGEKHADREIFSRANAIKGTGNAYISNGGDDRWQVTLKRTTPVTRHKLRVPYLEVGASVRIESL
jgi:hypothetical protein